MPTVVSFYLTVDERRALLKKLRAIDSDRGRAILIALRIKAGKGGR
jgi:hypothetical protein